MNVVKTSIHAFGRWYYRQVCRREFDRQTFRQNNERPIEYSFVFAWLNRLHPVSVLDVGTGMSALPSLLRTCGFIVTATDNIVDYWPNGICNRHFHVVQDDITKSSIQATFDVVLCISTLEHIKNYDAAVSSMFRLLADGGHLILTFPYHDSSYVANVYDMPDSLYGKGSPYICQSYSRKQLDCWLKHNNGLIVCQEYWQCFTGKHWTEGELVRPARETTKDDPHQLTCLVLQGGR